jgi:hypothetical protein
MELKDIYRVANAVIMISNDVGGQAGFSHLHNFLLLGLHSHAQRLDFSEQQDHQRQMFANSLLKSSLVSQAQSDVSRLLVQIFVLDVQPLYLIAQDSILNTISATFSMSDCF